MATYLIWSDSPTGEPLSPGNNPSHIRSSNTSWSSARSGSNLAVIQDYQHAGLALVDGTQFNVNQAFASFDTSVIGSSVVISAIDFRFALVFATTAIHQIQIREDPSWSYPLATGDWVSGGDLSSLELRGSRSIPIIPVGGVTFSIPVDSVNQTGSTKYVVHDARQLSASTPGGLTDRPAIWWPPGGASSPRLVVQVVTPSALHGVHEGAVQLSDGSTAYLEGDGSPTPVVTLKRVTGAGSVFSLASLEAQSYRGGLQSHTLVCDNLDTLYWVTARNGWLEISARDLSGNELGFWGYDGSTGGLGSGHGVVGVSATYVNQGLGHLQRGRILVIYVTDIGRFGYHVIDCGRILQSTGTSVDQGLYPSWLVPSNSRWNSAGTGFSVATGSFGGSRVGVFSWSWTYGVFNTFTGQGPPLLSTQAAKITVGQSISNVSVETITDFDPNGVRGRVVGYGVDSFVAVWNVSAGIMIKRIGLSGTRTIEDALFFDAVWDTDKIAHVIMIYYWNPADNTRLLRRPYYPASNTLGSAEEINEFGGSGVREIIRAPRSLRSPRFVEIHHSRTES